MKMQRIKGHFFSALVNLLDTYFSNTLVEYKLSEVVQ